MRAALLCALLFGSSLITPNATVADTGHATMGTARESSRGTFVIAECWDPVKRPKEMVFTCADADFTARGLSWKRWTRTSAKGTGRFECHGMTCNWERRGRITLWDRSYCGNIHRHVFMKGRVVLRRPVQGQDTMRVYPGCGFQE